MGAESVCTSMILPIIGCACMTMLPSIITNNYDNNYNKGFFDQKGNNHNSEVNSTIMIETIEQIKAMNFYEYLKNQINEENLSMGDDIKYLKNYKEFRQDNSYSLFINISQKKGTVYFKKVLLYILAQIEWEEVFGIEKSFVTYQALSDNLTLEEYSINTIASWGFPQDIAEKLREKRSRNKFLQNQFNKIQKIAGV